MNQPPPHGWHQQQAPPQQQGWQQPPPGWQQPQPGYGYPPSPKKSKAPLVIALVTGLLVLGGLATGLVLYLDANKDGGEPKRADKLPALCGNISETALAKARTTNPNGLGSSELSMGDDGKRTICSWHQTKGIDGTGYRGVDVYVGTGTKPHAWDFDRVVAQYMTTNSGVAHQKRLDGLGDQAAAVVVDGKSAILDIWIIVRKGNTSVEVNYTGWDAGIFTHTKPDVAEFEAAAKGLAEEMIAKL